MRERERNPKQLASICIGVDVGLHSEPAYVCRCECGYILLYFIRSFKDVSKFDDVTDVSRHGMCWLTTPHITKQFENLITLSKFRKKKQTESRERVLRAWESYFKRNHSWIMSVSLCVWEFVKCNIFWHFLFLANFRTFHVGRRKFDI